MITKNDWFKTNIRDKLIDPGSKVKIHIKPYDFEDVDFITSSKNAANELKQYGNLCFALSGGADSEFVCRILHSQNVDFETIITVTPYNSRELEWAHKLCTELDIKPKIIEVKEKEFIQTYKDVIYPLFNWEYVFSYVCARYAFENNKKFVRGVNIIGGDRNGVVYPGVYEFDFYSDIFFGEDFEIPFHLYSLEIAYKTIEFIKDQDEGMFKSQLYQTEYRPKMPFQYSNLIVDTISYLRRNKYTSIKEYLVLENRDILLNRFRNTGERIELPIDLQTYKDFK
jgi:hypothetical protein